MKSSHWLSAKAGIGSRLSEDKKVILVLAHTACRKKQYKAQFQASEE